MDTSKLNYSFHDFPGHTHWIMLANGRWCTLGVPRHAWLRCCVWWCSDRSLTVGTKTFCLCNHSARNRAEDFWEIFFSCFLCLCSTSRRIHENTTSTAGDGKSWLWHVAIDRTVIDCSTLLPRYANKLDGKHDLAGGTCMKLLRKGSTLNLARGCLAWIMDLPYWTVLTKTNQRHDSLVFFVALLDWCFFAQISFLRSRTPTKRYKTVLWISSNAEKMQFTSDYL